MTILELLPAIDVTGGQAVRLSSGSIDEGSWGSPIDVARSFNEAGARWVHLVDLDLAFGRGENSELLARVIREVPVRVELSGGIASRAAIEAGLAMGPERLNNATQARKAPGSAFKPITALAALEENVFGLTDTINCTGIYDEITPPLRCWIYPGRHGLQNIESGIRNSCNFFFADLGHRLATNAQGEYDPGLGMERLSKYAIMFGLDQKSGVEIIENDPMISNQSPERSAIGQGTNSFANVQLSRYVTALANRGTVFNLSVLDRVTDWQGEAIRSYEPNVIKTMDVKAENWDVVQRGMRGVVESGSASRIFKGLEVNIAGKTGTAQESKTRANHAFFISFGPYENPSLAVTVNIPYGYTSANAASVAKDVYRLCFGYTNVDEVLNAGAQRASDARIED